MTPLYDPLIAKLIVWDTDRERPPPGCFGPGRVRDRRPDDPGPVPQGDSGHRAVARAETCRDLIDDRKWLRSLAPEEPPDARARAERRARGGRAHLPGGGRRATAQRQGDRRPAGGGRPRQPPRVGPPPRRERAGRRGRRGATETLVSPIQGTVLRVAVSGDEVEDGALICVVEAMKMENEITAHRAGKVTELEVAEGGSVAAGDVIGNRIARRDSVARRCRGAAPARAAPTCRCRPPDADPSRRAMESAGGTSARTATSSCCARRGSRSESSDRPFGRSATATRREGADPHAVPGARGEVWTEDGSGASEHAREEARRSESTAGDRGPSRLPARRRWPGWSRCARGEGEYAWTRKLADVPIECDVRVGERRWQVEARGVEDESAGYHPRHTVWSWSAGVGRAATGAQWGGTWSAASTTRRSAPSARSGSTASRPSPAR